MVRFPNAEHAAPLPLFDPAESDRRKDEGIALVEANERNDWKLLAFARVVQVAELNHLFTADDIRDACESLGEPHHPNMWGALMKRAQSENVAAMTPVTRMSARPDAHSRRLPVWRSLVWRGR